MTVDTERSVKEFLSKAHSARNFQPLWDSLDKYAGANELEFLHALLRKLWKFEEPSVKQPQSMVQRLKTLRQGVCEIPPHTARSLSERILGLLALFPQEDLRLRFLAAVINDEECTWQPALVAAMAASKHEFDSLRQLYDSEPKNARFRSFLLSLTQELVMRGNDMRDFEPAAENLSEFEDCETLPLVRFEYERGVWFPTFSLNSKALPCASGHLEGRSLQSDRGSAAKPDKVSADHSIADVVSEWCRRSNGRVECKRFTFDRSLDAFDVTPPLIANLALEAFTESPPDVALVRPEDVYAMLHGAAYGGGAYPSELWQPLARKIALNSFWAMCGGADKVEAAHWYSVDPVSPWFEQVAWDFCLACLNPDGTELIVLAATDTD